MCAAKTKKRNFEKNNWTQNVFKVCQGATKPPWISLGCTFGYKAKEARFLCEFKAGDHSNYLELGRKMQLLINMKDSHLNTKRKDFLFLYIFKFAIDIRLPSSPPPRSLHPAVTTRRTLTSSSPPTLVGLNAEKTMTRSWPSFYSGILDGRSLGQVRVFALCSSWGGFQVGLHRF